VHAAIAAQRARIASIFAFPIPMAAFLIA